MMKNIELLAPAGSFEKAKIAFLYGADAVYMGTRSLSLRTRVSVDDYELNKKVPFIIWTRDKNFNKTVDTPMGMIDVLPTLGNMLGIHSDFQLGKDIFSLDSEDNTVVFVDGSYLTSKIYYNAPKSEIYAIINNVVSEEYIKERAAYANDIIDVSNDIISYNLVKELKGVCSR